MLQTNTYQNIAKFLVHPSKSGKKKQKKKNNNKNWKFFKAAVNLLLSIHLRNLSITLHKSDFMVGNLTGLILKWQYRE